MIDPRILQHALIHEGERRKLLVLLANGNLAAREAHPDDPMMREFARETGALKVRASAQPDAGSVASWRARLPDGAPDDIVLIGTRPLFDLVKELVAKSCEANPELYAQVLDVRIEPFAENYLTLARAEQSHSIDEWTLLAGLDDDVDIMVSDHFTAPSGKKSYSAGKHSVTIMTFKRFVAEYVERDDFSLESIDTTVLPDAGRLLQPPEAARARFPE